MQPTGTSNIKQELLERTTHTLKGARHTDPELVINVVLLLSIQFSVFYFLFT